MTVIAMLGGSEAACTAHVKVAIDIARRMDVPLQGLIAMPEPSDAVMYVGGGGEVAMIGAYNIDSVIAAQDETRAMLRAAFTRCVDTHGAGLKTECVEESGPVSRIAGAAATLATAFILPRGASKSDNALNPSFEHVLMEARLPMVLASGKGQGDGPCIIAWDGSAQAMRSVRLHMPLIAAHSKIIIATQSEKTRRSASEHYDNSSEQLREMLSARGVSAAIQHYTGSVSQGLMDLATREGAGLLVMGAYGHNRLGEMLFGGTSRAMLASETAPCLALAH